MLRIAKDPNQDVVEDAANKLMEFIFKKKKKDVKFRITINWIYLERSIE